MDIVIKVLQLLLSLSILVITHEGGHFFFAKLFKTRVEKFYLFFDPWFSLFKFQKGDTEYGIGWIPLGGYVKISGMIDESMDTDQMSQPVQPWEFRAKPAWQRMLIMLGGVLVNFISAPLILWGILFTWGETYIPYNEAKYGLQFHEAMHEIGFVDGDIITHINGNKVEKYVDDIQDYIWFEDACKVSVLRNGQNIDIQMPHEFFRTILTSKASMLCAIRFPVVVDSVIPNMGAHSAGIQHGDSITSIDGKTVSMVNEFVSLIENYKDSTVSISYVRNGIADTTLIYVNKDSKIGIEMYPGTRWIPVKHVEFGLLEALPAGITKGYKMLKRYIKQIPMIFTKEGSGEVGGFGSIGKMFPAAWNWEAFWFNTAFLAIMLAVLNVLPIPALDGGHVLFLLIEIIIGRPVSDKVLERAQTIGMLLLFALLIYGNGLDIIRAFK